MSDLSLEFAQGRAAFQNGLRKTDNPYEHGSTFAKLWAYGWDDADQEDELDSFSDCYD